MKVLLVTPVERGSGETITALHLAQNLIEHGHRALFLSSPFASAFISKHFPDPVLWTLCDDGARNREIWSATMRKQRPDLVVFADYPLMFFRDGVSPLAREPGWVESLDELETSLVTLDHFGFAQEERGYYFGPAHLTCLQYQKFPSLPKRMHILLPCPMHEPGSVNGRRGWPFRYWKVPLGLPEEQRRQVRNRYLQHERDILIFHSVPNWAWQAAEAMHLTFYQFLPEILDFYLGNLPRPVTIVSVNNGKLLQSASNQQVRLINLGPISTVEFEELLFSSDLVITENKVSISMGKAICGLQPCAVLKNSYGILELMDRLDGRLRRAVLSMENSRPGTVYPYEVFPAGGKDLLDEIILYRQNSLLEAFREIEIFGGSETCSTLHLLLTDSDMRNDLLERQLRYVDKLQKIGDGTQVLACLAEQMGG